MNRPEEIEFCKKRIIEQDEYILETVHKKMTFGRRHELITSAIAVRRRFRSRLIELIGIISYLHFRMYE